MRYSSDLFNAKSHGSLGRKSYSAFTWIFSSVTSDGGRGGSGLRFDGCPWSLLDCKNQGVIRCIIVLVICTKKE